MKKKKSKFSAAPPVASDIQEANAIIEELWEKLAYFGAFRSVISAVADALMDRLVHNSHRIELGGESMRKLAQSDHLE
ncbi:Transposase [Vibrio diabolicus E0666]|nr:Transposase [Vibrio diabolicus E0666]